MVMILLSYQAVFVKKRQSNIHNTRIQFWAWPSYPGLASNKMLSWKVKKEGYNQVICFRGPEVQTTGIGVLQ